MPRQEKINFYQAPKFREVRKWKFFKVAARTGPWRALWTRWVKTKRYMSFSEGQWWCEITLTGLNALQVLENRKVQNWKLFDLKYLILMKTHRRKLKIQRGDMKISITDILGNLFRRNIQTFQNRKEVILKIRNHEVIHWLKMARRQGNMFLQTRKH